MDVPVFVGFAADGPIDRPVVVEDVDAFTGVFGGEVTIVLDDARAQPVHGELRAAVRAFFRNGGRRCWIIRLANPQEGVVRPGELSPLTAAWFLDDDLADVPTARLLDDADFIRYAAEPTRSLRGIHAALEVDEATLLVVPDAALPAWGKRIVAVIPTVVEAARQSLDVETFEACESGPPAQPEPVVRRFVGRPSKFRISWPPVDGATGYEVESTREPGSRRGPSIIATAGTTYTMTRARAGTYRLRVRGVGPGGTGKWSEPLRIVVDLTPRYRLEPRGDRSTAVAVHAAMLRLCAARGDLFAILSLPEAVDADGALQHVADVRSLITGFPASVTTPPSREADPTNVLSFGALYHPWLLTADALESEPGATTGPGGPRRRRPQPTPAGAHPPDGALAGVFADRAARRGAWIAPGNVPLDGIVGLTLPLRDHEIAELQVGQVNVVRQTPSGFRALSTQTLALDSTFRPINVRRLLALLRRLAVLHGVDYAFEPNDSSFRRRIQRGFEALLASLHERGAFAGKRADDSFRVVVGDPPNSRQSLDAGRLIVELKVAPSTPLEFLTVRLVRLGERLAVEVASA
jgi:hypothetical protein